MKLRTRKEQETKKVQEKGPYPVQLFVVVLRLRAIGVCRQHCALVPITVHEVFSIPAHTDATESVRCKEQKGKEVSYHNERRGTINKRKQGSRRKEKTMRENERKRRPQREGHTFSSTSSLIRGSFLICLARQANFSVEMESETDSKHGLTHAIKVVKQFPPRL